MTLSPLTIQHGQFMRDGQRFIPVGPVYFARNPGTCGAPYFADEYWPQTLSFLERDFARMHELGFTMAVPFIKTSSFWQDGQPVERMYERVQYMIDLARQYALYLIPFPNCDAGHAPHILGRPREGDDRIGREQIAFNPYLYEAMVKDYLQFALRFGQDPVVPVIMGISGSRLWTGYAGFRPGEPEAQELLPLKPYWQAWLQEQYADDFAAFLADHPRLPEHPTRWNEVALPVEVEGQFTEADSRTFTFLRFQASTLAVTNRRFFTDIRKEAPWTRSITVHEGCEWNTGPQQTYIPGLGDFDAAWVEMYGFNMSNGSTIAPNWQRQGFFEPTTGKDLADSFSVVTEAWERLRYLKAAAPDTALIPCHGSVMGAFTRWTMEPRDQRILFERIQRTYLEGGADGLGFWSWTDDESSARPEPEFIEREGETTGVIDMHERYRPIARRVYAYQHAQPPATQVCADVLLLRPIPYFMGMDMIDGNMTAACLTSALARLGVAPDVKSTWHQGRGPIPLAELQPYKLVVVAADEYYKDFPAVPQALLDYAAGGGRVLLAMSDPRTMLTPTFQEVQSDALFQLLGCPEVEATYHQHFNPWTVSLRWRLRNGAVPYWDQRQARYMPGRREKPFTFKWVTLPDSVDVLAEAVAPAPYKGDDPAELQKYFTQQQKVSPWSPLFYRHTVGQGAVFVFTYSLNVFRARLDEIDVQRDDWDWLLQAAIDDANVTTNPFSGLSVLAQEFLNFRPTK